MQGLFQLNAYHGEERPSLLQRTAYHEGDDEGGERRGGMGSLTAEFREVIASGTKAGVMAAFRELTQERGMESTTGGRGKIMNASFEVGGSASGGGSGARGGAPNLRYGRGGDGGGGGANMRYGADRGHGDGAGRYRGTPTPAAPYNGKNIDGLSPEATRQYAAILGQRESGNRYGITNPYGYVGRWQMGADALAENGYVKRGTTNRGLNDPSVWTGKGDVHNVEEFKANKGGIQDREFGEYTNRHYAELRKAEVIRDGMSPADTAGWLAAAHLKGVGGATALARGHDNVDANGTSASSYRRMMAGVGRDDLLSDAAVAPKPTLQAGDGKMPAWMDGKSQRELAGVNKGLAGDLLAASEATGQHFRVLQGLRTQAEANHNAATGAGVRNSQHLYGAAADIRLTDDKGRDLDRNDPSWNRYAQAYEANSRASGGQGRWLGHVPGWSWDRAHFDQGIGYGEHHARDPFGVHGPTKDDVAQGNKEIFKSPDNPFLAKAHDQLAGKSADALSAAHRLMKWADKASKADDPDGTPITTVDRRDPRFAPYPEPPRKSLLDEANKAGLGATTIKHEGGATIEIRGLPQSKGVKTKTSGMVTAVNLRRGPQMSTPHEMV